MKYARILVPLDGSLLAECALPLAGALARRTGAAIVLLRVADTGSPAGDSGGMHSVAAAQHGASAGSGSTATNGEITAAEEEARRYLEATEARVKPEIVPESLKVATGDPATAVLEAAASEHADLIAMATHGRSGLARSVLGSVTDRVALQSAVPVLVVRSASAPGMPVPAVAVRNVLVPLDRSELSESALPHARAFAGAFGARIELLVAEHPAGHPTLADTARAYLSKVAAGLEMQSDRITTTVADGDAKTEIAARLQALPDVVTVMTTRGASGLVRWIRGSVTDAVVRSSLAPTVIVPPVAPVLGPAIH